MEWFSLAVSVASLGGSLYVLGYVNGRRAGLRAPQELTELERQILENQERLNKLTAAVCRIKPPQGGSGTAPPDPQKTATTEKIPEGSGRVSSPPPPPPPIWPVKLGRGLS